MTMKSFIQVQKGKTPRQAHVDLGGLKDDELGRKGFAGRHAQLYRQNDPTQYRAGGSYRPRKTSTRQLATPDQSDPRGQPLTLLSNDDCRIRISRRTAAMPYYLRNVNGDEAYFIHQGSGIFETEFGDIAYEPGDYVVMPKAVTYRILPAAGEQLSLLIETSDELQVPDYGLLGRHAPFDPTLIQAPEPRVLPSGGQSEWEVVIQHGGSELSSIFYKHNPCDVEGYKGDLFPFKFNIRDWNVILSDTLHLPPSVHCFLQARGVEIMNFLPRPAEGKVGAERVPWYHRNADNEEVLFFHGGSFLGAPMPLGLLDHAPQGLHHGAPEFAREMARKTHDKFNRIEWQIIAIEAQKPLTPSEAFKQAAE